MLLHFFLLLTSSLVVIERDTRQQQLTSSVDTLYDVKSNESDCRVISFNSCDPRAIASLSLLKSPPSSSSTISTVANECNCHDDKIKTIDKETSPVPVKRRGKTIYVITPTYTRPSQAPDLTRIAQTLELAALKFVDIFWIVSEDAPKRSKIVSDIMSQTNLPTVHLLGPRPQTHLDKRSGRGVSNRLAGLNWLRSQFTGTTTQGIIYFADDDNSYDIRVFDEMKNTNGVSVWPVGMIAKVGVSSPILDITNASVIGFHDPFMTRRKFAVDMAGFAVDLQLFLTKVKATMPYKVGYEEDYFIRSLGVKMADLEPKANNCTMVGDKQIILMM